ncbi:unnamed protein product [Protopolystoma xenopodis]|uniref:Uncharacterized protein n=1 Tax=Protopolystoma xenopodis TaxID=117903 RepID=A0A448WAZ4_9PLAT|nr:unnamed protein product [Protopolystoma xenopodis]
MHLSAHSRPISNGYFESRVAITTGALNDCVPVPAHAANATMTFELTPAIRLSTSRLATVATTFRMLNFKNALT